MKFAFLENSVEWIRETDGGRSDERKTGTGV
ncbi:MAG: hypothetical protein QOG55_2429 [Acidobacteriaceae bacterium]|jgi:hypothetical protein|nr:hypothetical protein [Acidobacteriaceae bacterium]